MQPYVNAQIDMRNIHEKCKKHLYQIIQIELNDGTVYQGILHSYDREKLYLIMSHHHEPHDHHHHGHHHHHHSGMGMNDESRLFPFFGPFGLYGFPFFGIRRFGPFFPFFI